MQTIFNNIVGNGREKNTNLMLVAAQSHERFNQRGFTARCTLTKLGSIVDGLFCDWNGHVNINGAHVSKKDTKARKTTVK